MQRKSLFRYLLLVHLSSYVPFSLNHVNVSVVAFRSFHCRYRVSISLFEDKWIPGNNFSLPSACPSGPSFHFTQVQPFLVKVLLWQKVAAVHYFPFVLGNCVTTCSVLSGNCGSGMKTQIMVVSLLGLVPNSNTFRLSAVHSVQRFLQFQERRIFYLNRFETCFKQSRGKLNQGKVLQCL